MSDRNLRPIGRSDTNFQSDADRTPNRIGNWSDKDIFGSDRIGLVRTDSNFFTNCAPLLWVLSFLRTTIFREILVVTYLVTIPVNVVGTFTSTWQIICPVNFDINGLWSGNIKREAKLLLKNKNLIYFHAELCSTLLVFLNSASFCKKLTTNWSNNTKG